jgi:hypothetical protein
MYGIVHRAINSTNNQVVAIKEIDLQMIEVGKLDGVMVLHNPHQNSHPHRKRPNSLAN